MNFKHVATGILLILLAFVISVNAIELKASEDTIYISSTEGKVFVYVKNTATDDRNLYLSADGRELNAYIEPYEDIVHAGATGGAYVHVVAPDCFRGSEAIQIYAQLCSDTACDSTSRKIVVNVEPARQCANYIDGYASSVQFVSGTSCGATGCYQTQSIEPKRSKLVNAAYFDPTSYDVRVTGGDSCVDLKRGGIARVKLSLSNRGAAGNFDMRVISGSEVNAFPSKDYVSLQRSNAEDVYIDIKPDQDAAAGSHYATLQVLHLDEMVAQKDVCIDLQDESRSTLIVPDTVNARTSRGSTVQIEVSNDGTKQENYEVSVYSDVREAMAIIPEAFVLKPGAKRYVDIEIDTSKLSKGNYKMHFVITTEEDELVADSLLKVVEDAAMQGSSVAVEAQQSQKDNALEVTGVIKNDGDTDLTDLDVEVQGLPEGWKVSDIDPITVKANSEKQVKFEITMTSQEDASPKMVVKKGGYVLGVQSLPKISGKAGGFTGLFALNSQNVILGIVVLGVILLFFMVGRRDEPGSTTHEHSHMESIKHEVEHGGSHSH
ncbi:MAG: hypothetical protein V1835_02730 [Candidatus Micrarchaeota archaeon]